MLDETDTYYVFDFEDKLKDFSDDLKAYDFGIKCKILPFGNSHDSWDSYNWNLSNMVLGMRQMYLRGIFDVVYLDGAHTLCHDGLAVCLLKELIKDGGILVLDDLFWTYSSSNWGKNFAPGRLPKEQMTDMQILRVQEIFLANDPNFEKLSPPNAYRGIFRKRSSK